MFTRLIVTSAVFHCALHTLRVCTRIFRLTGFAPTAFLSCFVLGGFFVGVFLAPGPSLRPRGALLWLPAVKALYGGKQGRALILKPLKNVDVLSIAFAPMPLAPDLQFTSRARMTRRPPAAECREQPACGPTFHGPQSISRPDTTESKTKWNGREHLNQP